MHASEEAILNRAYSAHTLSREVILRKKKVIAGVIGRKGIYPVTAAA
jgi:hypothetical protein